MVLVPVCDQVAAQFVATLQRIGRVGNDVVDAVHVFRGKEQAGVDDDHVIGRLVDHHVAADFAQAAQRHDPHGVAGDVGHVVHWFLTLTPGC